MSQMQHFRFLPIQLSENSNVPGADIKEHVQLLRTGTYHHPQYGTFEITKMHLADMVKNFREKVRGVDIAIDYAHKSDTEAAAWITDLSLGGTDETELWANVKWTPIAKEKLLAREYRYLSADFTFEYQDNESLQKFGPTLLGAGLTNRPVVKNMAAAIELSEGRENLMDPKDKEIADLKALVADLQKKLEAASGSAGELGEVKAKLADMEKKCGELEGEKKVLADAKVLSEKTSKFNALLSEGKVVEAQREAFISGDAIKLAELSQPVKLADKGNKDNPPPAAKTKDEAEKEILKLAEEKTKNNSSLSLADAVSQVRAANPELVKLCQ